MPGLPKSEKTAGGMDWELHWELRALAMLRVLWVLTSVPWQPLGKK